MADFDLTKLRPGSGDSSIAAVSAQMITDAVNTTSVERGWRIADTAASVDKLFDFLQGPSLTSKTFAELFDNVSETALLMASSASSLLAEQLWVRDILAASSQGITAGNPNLGFYSTSGIVDEGLVPDAAAGYFLQDPIVFNSDGTKAFSVKSGNVNEWPLSTPYDLSTHGTRVNHSFLGEFQNATDIAFTADGLNMYVGGENTSNHGTLFRYLLTTPWDITTATQQETAQLITSNTSYDEVYVVVSPDGTRIAVNQHSTTSSSITYAYDMSASPNDLSSWQFTGDGPKDFDHWSFSPDGKVLYVLTGLDTLRAFTLQTPYDVASIPSTQSYEYNAEVPSASLDVDFNSSVLGHVVRAYSFYFDPATDDLLLVNGETGVATENHLIRIPVGYWV